MNNTLGKKYQVWIWIVTLISIWLTKNIFLWYPVERKLKFLCSVNETIFVSMVSIIFLFMLIHYYCKKEIYSDGK